MFVICIFNCKILMGKQNVLLCQMSHQFVPSGVNRIVVWATSCKNGSLGKNQRITKGESVEGGVENSTLRSNHTWGLTGGAAGLLCTLQAQNLGVIHGASSPLISPFSGPVSFTLYLLHLPTFLHP